MRDKFWRMFYEMKYRERYYWHYQIRSKRINGLVSAICMIASASSIAAWGIWSQYPVVWAVIIAISQVFSVTKPLHPQADQLVAFKFIIPAISDMLVRIEYDWEQIDSEKYSDDEIKSVLRNYKNEYNALENTYIGDLYLPASQNCVKLAEKECKDYFYLYYDVKEVDNNAKETKI